MKSYPSIPHVPEKLRHDQKYLDLSGSLFAKYDGSCIRIEWNKKEGFHKFGRRHGLLDDSYPILKKAPELFIRRYAELLHPALHNAGFESATCFAEFYGSNSFAGMHDENEQQEVRLFDIAPYKKGLLFPSEFKKLCEGIPTQEELYCGKLSSEIIDSIIDSTMPNMPFEGVIFKGMLNPKSGPLMFKIKSKQWIDKLKQYCGDDHEKFKRMA